jgi:hypothetical protein
MTPHDAASSGPLTSSAVRMPPLLSVYRNCDSHANGSDVASRAASAFVSISVVAMSRYMSSCITSALRVVRMRGDSSGRRSSVEI